MERFPVDEDSFGLKAIAKPSQGLPQIISHLLELDKSKKTSDGLQTNDFFKVAWHQLPSYKARWYPKPPRSKLRIFQKRVFVVTYSKSAKEE